MRVWSITALLLLSACATGPRVTYSNGGAVGVTYRPNGLLNINNEKEAYAVLEAECHGAYRVTGRSERDNRSNIDAVCVR